MPIQPLIMAAAGRRCNPSNPCNRSALGVIVRTEIEKDPWHDLLPSEERKEELVKDMSITALYRIV